MLWRGTGSAAIGPWLESHPVVGRTPKWEGKVPLWRNPCLLDLNHSAPASPKLNSFYSSPQPTETWGEPSNLTRDRCDLPEGPACWPQQRNGLKNPVLFLTWSDNGSHLRRMGWVLHRLRTWGGGGGSTRPKAARCELETPRRQPSLISQFGWGCVFSLERTGRRQDASELLDTGTSQSADTQALGLQAFLPPAPASLGLSTALCFSSH